MSHLRNRFRSTSQSFHIQKRNSQGTVKMNNSIRFTPDNTMSSSLMNVPRHKSRPNTTEEKSYMGYQLSHLGMFITSGKYSTPTTLLKCPSCHPSANIAGTVLRINSVSYTHLTLPTILLV